MCGKGISHDNASIEMFFKTIKVEPICGIRGKRVDGLRWQFSNTSTGSTIRDGGTQYLAGKALSFSNERWLKRACGATLRRDNSGTSTTGQRHFRLTRAAWDGQVANSMPLGSVH